MALNVVILMGRLVRDPDIRYSQSGDNMAIARFTLAVERILLAVYALADRQSLPRSI